MPFIYAQNPLISKTVSERIGGSYNHKKDIEIESAIIDFYKNNCNFAISDYKSGFYILDITGKVINVMIEVWDRPESEFIEIWSACTGLHVRGQKRLSPILKMAVEYGLSVGKGAWLSVELDNSQFEKIASIYIKKGFHNHIKHLPAVSQVQLIRKFEPINTRYPIKLLESALATAMSFKPGVLENVYNTIFPAPKKRLDIRSHILKQTKKALALDRPATMHDTERLLEGAKTVLGLKRMANMGDVTSWNNLINKLEYQKTEPNVVVPWVLNDSTMPFYILHLLKKHGTTCFKKSFGGTIYIRVNAGHFTDGQGSNYVPWGSEVDRIREMYNSCKKNVMVIPMGLYDMPSDIPHAAHANMLILNKERMEFEHYEPHGGAWVVKGMDKFMRKLNKDLNLGLEYVGNEPTCPRGFQHYEQYAQDNNLMYEGVQIANNTGWCGAWAFYYADQRLKYPKPSRDVLKQTIFAKLDNSPEGLRNFILGQSNLMSAELHKINEKYPFKDYIKALKNLKSNDEAIRLSANVKFNEANAYFGKYLEFEFGNL